MSWAKNRLGCNAAGSNWVGLQVQVGLDSRSKSGLFGFNHHSGQVGLVTLSRVRLKNTGYQFGSCVGCGAFL